MVLEIKQHERCSKCLFDFHQCLTGQRCIEFLRLVRFRYGLEFVGGVVQRLRTRFAPARIDKFAVKGGEKPGLDLAGRIDLVRFDGKFTKRFLSEVERWRLAMSEREGEPVKALIMRIHDLLER